MKRLLIVLTAVVFLTNGYAQTLRLEDAINIALKNSLDIQLARNGVSSATVLNNYGVAGGLPTVSATGSDNEQITSINQKFSDPTRNTLRNNAASNNLNTNLTGNILLYNGMRVVAAKSRLGQLQAQSEQMLNSQVQNTLASVMTAYYDVVRQQYYIKTIDQSISTAQQKLDIVKKQQSVGMANNADLFQAQLDLNNLLQAKQTQQLVIDQAKASLLTVLTIRPDSLVNIADTIVVSDGIQLQTVLDKLKGNADIMAAGDQIRINEQLVKETGAQRYPSLRGTAGYGFSRSKNAAGFSLLNQSYGPTIGVSVTVPIYNGSIYKRQQRVAKINVKNAEIQQQQLLRDYTGTIVKTYQAYQNNLQQLNTARENQQLALQLLSLVLQRFQLRQATLLEVNRAQQSFETASYSLTNLSYAAKAAEIELNRVANQLKF